MPTPSATARPDEPPLPAHADVAVIGAGFSGLAMAAALKRAGREDFVVLERGDDVGGTWRDNAYPGCACDVPSLLYSFSFAPNPGWSSTFSPQAEIQAYIRRVARDAGLLPRVRFGCEVREARWDGAAGRWRIATSRGELTARVVVAAAGPLSEPKVPALPGLDRFRGAVFHSARWDHAHDLAGERVAVVGTGASAIQFVPEIAPRVATLAVYQRTPPWVVPRPARPLTRLEHAVYRRAPLAQRAVREAIYWSRELYAIPLLHAPLARAAARLARAHLERQVPDPSLRARLTPTYAPGCKRVLISNDWYPALLRPNVELVTDPIAEVRERSIVTRDGVERGCDAVVFGTGFHVADMPIASRLRGADGRTMAERWGGSLEALRGTTVTGFPNLFLLLGPNTGLGHTSVVLMAEAQVDYAMRALAWMDRRGVSAIEPRPEAQARWNADVQRRMVNTVWTAGGCASWYLDAKGRNTTLWPDFSYRFRQALSRFDPVEYRASAAAARGADARRAAAGSLARAGACET